MMHRTDVSPTALQCRFCVARGCSACTRSAGELGAIFHDNARLANRSPFARPRSSSRAVGANLLFQLDERRSTPLDLIR